MKLRFDLKYKTLTLAAIPILGLLGAAILMSGIAAKVAAGLVQQGAIYRAFETRQEAFISSINLMINLYYIPVEGPPTGDQGAKQAIAAESHLFLGKVKALQESLSSFSDRPPDTYVDAAQKFDRLGERITGKRLEAGEQKPTDLQRDSLLLNGWSAIGKQLAALDTYLEDLNKSNSETLFREIQGSAITVLLIVAFNWALAIFLAVQYTRKIVRPALEIRRNSGLIGTVAELPAIDCDNDEFRDLSRALNFAHEELLLSTKKMHDLIDWSTALVLTANRKAMITSSNQACRYIIGVSPDNLVNRSLFDFVEAESRARVRQLCSQAGNLKDDIILLTVDGRRVECSMDATFNAERNSYILVIVDKSHENLLTKSRQELKSLLAQDVRTPLLEIATLLQSCKSEAALAAPLASSAIDAAQANSALMLELSAQLNDLYLQKIEGDEHHEVDLKQVLEESIALLTPLACQKDVSITATLAFSRAFGKRSQLSRLCNNLLANAVRFSPPGGEIAINLKNQNKDWLIFEIKDQGPGIDTADAADIFAPFVQAGAEKGRKSGFGLGLSICRRIVQSANGEIGYRPGDNGKNKPQTAGPGSIFWVKLPRYK